MCIQKIWNENSFLFVDYEKAEEYGKTYATTPGPGTTCRPHEHLFYRKLGPVVRRTLEKCTRENGFMWEKFLALLSLHFNFPLFFWPFTLLFTSLLFIPTSIHNILVFYSSLLASDKNRKFCSADSQELNAVVFKCKRIRVLIVKGSHIWSRTSLCMW